MSKNLKQLIKKFVRKMIQGTSAKETTMYFRINVFDVNILLYIGHYLIYNNEQLQKVICTYYTNEKIKY